MIYADVLVAKRGSSEQLTYTVPAAIIPYIRQGCMVTVPVRQKSVPAVVIHIHQRIPAELRGKIREMTSIERKSGFSEGQMAAVTELAEQYLTNPSDVLFRALNQPRRIVGKAPEKPGGVRYFQADWSRRAEHYRQITKEYEETMILFATNNHLHAFAEPGDIALDGSAKARKAVAAANRGVVFLGTVGDAFFPLSNNALVIVDQPDHIGAQYSSRPFLKAVDIIQARARHEGFDCLFGQAIIRPQQLLDVQKKNIELESRTEKIPLLVCSRLGSKELLLPTIIEEMESALAEGEKVALLVVSKGWANAYFCRDCLTVVACQRCHRPAGVANEQLHCRYCGHRADLPTQCPNCSKKNLVTVGEGIDQIVDEIRKQFPHTSLQVLAGNRKIEPKAAQVTIATEKILSFPQLRFGKVIVVSADRALSASAIDGPWRLLNILLELAGQAKVMVVQTYFPEHRVFEALSTGDLRQFFQVELGERKSYGLPPYGYALRLRGQANSLSALEAQAAALEKAARTVTGANSSGLEIIQQVGGHIIGELQILSPLSREQQLRKKLADTLLPNWTLV